MEKEFTHVAVPKDLMNHLWAYLEQKPFKEVSHILTAQGFQRVNLAINTPTLVPAAAQELVKEKLKS